ncbi:hypothetical protein BDY21DRAFT_271338, partial [Lineolata rhizophorae]
RLRALNAHNLRTLREQPLAELSGALGDLGTLLPLLLALALAGTISLPRTLLFTGAANIATGVFFGVPLPVQPMKAIASIALSRSFSPAENAAAGIVVAAAVGVLAITGALGWLGRNVPVPVVKGIQVGAGLSLVLSGGKATLLGGIAWDEPGWHDNYGWAIAAFLLLLTCARRPRAPAALILFLAGLILAIVHLRTSHHHHDHPPHHIPPVLIPSGRTFLHAALTASLGQLPLTVLNSILAVSHLSADLFPHLPCPTPTALGLSVALTNLASNWFAAMPACHGSGGLAAQARFGARSGASVVVLGAAKMALGAVALRWGAAVSDALAHFPRAVLGVMVVAAGVELAKVGESLNAGARDLWEEVEAEAESRGERGGGSADAHGGGGVLVKVKRPREPTGAECRDRWEVMLATVAALLAFRNDAVGFVAGMLWHWGLRVPEWWESSRMGAVRRCWAGWRRRRDEEGERQRLLS